MSTAVAEPAGRPRRGIAPASRLVAGRAVSDCGDWLTTVAVAVALYTITGSLAGPAMAILLRVVPRPVGALAGGRLADRFGPLRTLVALNVGRAAVTGALSLALHLGAVPAALGLLALSQAAGGAAQPAGQAAIPRLVPATAVARLNAAVGAVDSTALVLGPGLAAGLLGLFGAGSAAWLIGADALSFVALAALLSGLPSSPAGDLAPAASGRGAPWAGMSMVLCQPFLRQLALAQLGIFGAITCLQAVLPAAAEQRLGNPAAAGWIYAAVGAGNAAGALLMLRTRRRGLSRRALAILTLGELLPLGAIALVGSAWVDVGLAGISGLASAPYEILAATEVARRVAPQRLGQTSATIWLFGYSGMAGGGLLATLLAPHLGWGATLLIACLGGTAILLTGWGRRPLTVSAPPGPVTVRAAARPSALDHPGKSAELWNTSSA